MEGFSTSAEVGRPRGSQREWGDQTVSLGIRARWEKRKSGGFQSLHSDGENNPAQGEKKKITNQWGGIVPICVRNEGVD